MTHRHERRCRELVEQLSRFIDGDLSGVERRAIALHLRQCPCCDEFAASLRHTVRLCQEAGRTELPRVVRARARARIRLLLGKPPRRGRRPRR